MFYKTAVLSLCLVSVLADVPWSLDVNNRHSNRNIKITKIEEKDCWVTPSSLKVGATVYAGHLNSYPTTERTSGSICGPAGTEHHQLKFTMQDGGQRYTVIFFRHIAAGACQARVTDQSGKYDLKEIPCHHLRRIDASVAFYDTGFPNVTIAPGDESTFTMDTDQDSVLDPQLQDEQEIDQY